jgi:cyclohexyl-isocyanide hydratase
VLSRVPGAKVDLAWKSREMVMTDVGFTINPTVTFEECPRLEVLCVPGGFGVIEQLNGAETLEFLRTQGRTARYVTSVCNGSLLLDAKYHSRTRPIPSAGEQFLRLYRSRTAAP